MENTKSIPVFEYKLANDKASLFGISLVEMPAIQSDFILMEEEPTQKFEIQSEEKRLITGAVLIPGVRIERFSDKIGKYYGWFSKNTIRQLVYNSSEKGDFKSKFSFQHNGKEVEGLHLVESWFVDKVNDKSKSFKLNLPEDTYMMSLYCPEDENWKSIKEKGLKGFSIEIKTEHLDLAESNFQMQNYCSINYKQVIQSIDKKIKLEDNLESNVDLSNMKELNLEKWNSNCGCSNCTELKNLGYSLPGVLPDGEKEYRVIK